MNLLTGLLPGLRHVRAPIASGALWSLVALVLSNGRTGLVSRFGLGPLEDALSDVPELVQLLALAFSVYVVGLVVQAALSSVAGPPMEVFRWAVNLLPSFSTYLGRDPSLKDRMRQILGKGGKWLADVAAPRRGRDVRDHLEEAWREAVARGGGHRDLAKVVPLPVLARAMPSSRELVGLDPGRFSEVDRLEADAEFRYAVALPLAALGIVIGAGGTWIWILVGLIAASVLGRQGQLLYRTSLRLKARMVATRKVSLPLVAAVPHAIGSSELRVDSVEEAVADLVVGLNRMGFWSEVHDVLEAALYGEWELAEFAPLKRQVLALEPELDWIFEELEPIDAADTAS